MYLDKYMLYIRVASSGHGTPQDMDIILSVAESRHEWAGRTTRHGWHGTVEKQAQHCTDNTGTVLRTGMARTTQADDVACQGTAWHGRAQPDLADTRAEGREPFGLHNQPRDQPGPRAG